MFSFWDKTFYKYNSFLFRSVVVSVFCFFAIFNVVLADEEKPMHKEGRIYHDKPLMVFDWDIGFSTFATNNVLMSSGNYSVADFAPGGRMVLTRNYTDSTFLIFEALLQAVFINVDGAGNTYTNGIGAMLTMGAGHDVVKRNGHRLAVTGGFSGQYANMYVYLDQPPQDLLSNLQSNIHFGGYAWGGLLWSVEFMKRHTIVVQGRIGFGGYGVMFNGYGKFETAPVPALAIVPAASFEYRFKLYNRNYFRLFVSTEVPVFNVPSSVSAPQSGAWWNHMNVYTGVGFSVDI